MAAPIEKCEAQTEDDCTIDSSDKYSHAKLWLFQKLGKGGMVIIKHGRYGRPKTRRLQCDFGVSRVFCRSDSVYKEVLLSDIQSVRRGSDVDPASELDPIFASGSDASDAMARKNHSPLFRKKQTILDQPQVKFGTANLRRYCRAEDMPLCVSLITEDRSFDIQFMDLHDANDFHTHMSAMVAQNVATRPSSMGGAGTPADALARSASVQEDVVEDDVHAALDIEFLISQGFTEEQIMSMCEGIREEALLRSKKTENIRKSLSVKLPVDIEKETTNGRVSTGASSVASSDTEDEDLSAEDKAAVNKLMREKGYSEEQALQVYLQSLFITEEVAINMDGAKDTAMSPDSNRMALTTTTGDLQV